MPDAVISGCYADFKIIKTRSVAQLIVEIPIERAAEAVALFGVPQPGQEIHVAVARLQVPALGGTMGYTDRPPARWIETGNAIPAPASPPPGERSASGLGGKTTGAEPGREYCAHGVAKDGLCDICHAPWPRQTTSAPVRPWDTIPRAQQAGIKCGDRGFQKWLDTLETPSAIIEFADAKWPRDPNKWYGALVHYHCQVASRAEFSNKNNPAAGDRWDRFLARYDAESNRTAEERG